MYGWHGRILHVNLTSREIREETFSEEVARKYFGARGLAIKVLLEGMDPQADPLSPENLLVMATGPLTSTPAPTGNRYLAICKSPLTGALAYSNSGGVFPTMMKRSGYDLFVFRGKAEKPVYLYVDERKAEFRDASHLWGKDTHATEDLIRAETTDDTHVACIGPAGERLARIAAIINDKHRAAARSGVGAVMGSKNLKAVAVRGDLRPALYDEKALKAVTLEANRQLGADIKRGSTMRIYGTSYVPDVTNEAGVFPTLNFQYGQFEVTGLRAVNQSGWRNLGRTVCRSGRGTRVRDDWLLGQRLWYRQHGCHHQGQLSVQRAWPGHHLDRRYHCLRYGDVQQRHPDGGADRPATALWRCRRHDRHAQSRRLS
jgi:aldehyde:ferredoxin oxidoreductase